ncbi:hypothetical protein P5V15_006230 [Pogonomyrmex californicus]
MAAPWRCLGARALFLKIVSFRSTANRSGKEARTWRGRSSRRDRAPTRHFCVPTRRSVKLLIMSILPVDCRLPTQAACKLARGERAGVTKMVGRRHRRLLSIAYIGYSIELLTVLLTLSRGVTCRFDVYDIMHGDNALLKFFKVVCSFERCRAHRAIRVRSLLSSHVLLIGVNHGAACRRNPLDLRRRDATMTTIASPLIARSSCARSRLAIRARILNGREKKMAAVGFEPTPPKRLVP